MKITNHTFSSDEEDTATLEVTEWESIVIRDALLKMCESYDYNNEAYRVARYLHDTLGAIDTRAIPEHLQDRV